MRIGLVLNILDEAYQLSVYKGIKSRARELGIELVCFQQENTKFTTDSLISSFPGKNYCNIDGMLLLTSVIIDSYQINSREDVQRIWGNLPLISIGQKIQDVPSILIQTDDSMKQLVEHLILIHKYRKFVFIGGSRNHHDAISRETIFVQSMEAYKAWFPELTYTIKRGNFTERDAIDALTEYYKDENTVQPDVIVCANDNMALGVYKFFRMNRDNKKIKECPVTGFDDIPQARFELPSLTTVHQPLEEIGEFAVDSIISYINGEQISEDSYIESKVILRNSCGCTEHHKEKDSINEFLGKIQQNYLFSERQLRMVSQVEQDLNYAQALGGLRFSINSNLEQLDIPDFCILQFISENGKIVDKKTNQTYVIPVYLRKNFKNIEEIYNIDKISFGEFFEKYVMTSENKSESLVFKYLTAGKDIIGCVMYNSSENILPYMVTIGISIAQALNRIKFLEEKMQRAEYLENEVNKRTKDLVEANMRRMEVEAEVLKISEIERQRFSNDLHDDICQRLAGISMLCRSYTNQEEGIDKNQMLEISELVSDTLQRTRQYAHNSYPVDLESLGMNYSISNLCNSFENQSGLKCTYEWKVESEEIFDKTEKLNIFRIIQEALHNILKHAKSATSFTVSVKSIKNETVVLICDDGCGIPDLENGFVRGIGLNSMQYRANQIGATFEIYPAKPKGTCIEVRLIK